MTAMHIVTLAVFVFIGAAGLASIQESLALCWRSLFPCRRDARIGRHSVQPTIRISMPRYDRG